MFNERVFLIQFLQLDYRHDSSMLELEIKQEPPDEMDFKFVIHNVCFCNTQDFFEVINHWEWMCPLPQINFLFFLIVIDLQLGDKLQIPS